MKVKYIIPEGYEIDRRGKRKPLREYVEADFEGLYYNGEVKKFARYYVFENTDVYWYLDRHEIGDDVIGGYYFR